jgi:uncharacterized membrane protein YvbJ
MVKFCQKCGAKQENDSAKFCQSCGASFSSNIEKNNDKKLNNAITCLYCGSKIPIGSNKCMACGNYLNPSANEKHTALIVIGYICSFIPFVSLISFILGIYLLTRPNKKVHKHGIIIIVITVIVVVIAIALWLSYVNYVNRIRSYSYYNPYYY